MLLILNNREELFASERVLQDNRTWVYLGDDENNNTANDGDANTINGSPIVVPGHLMKIDCTDSSNDVNDDSNEEKTNKKRKSSSTTRPTVTTVPVTTTTTPGPDARYFRLEKDAYHIYGLVDLSVETQILVLFRLLILHGSDVNQVDEVSDSYMLQRMM